MTPDPIDSLYLELKSLAHNPDPTQEKELLAKIQSWTLLLIKAVQEDDSVTCTDILKRQTYLSQKMIQTAGCFPLHRLAKMPEWKAEDKALFEALLDTPGYFHLSDLDAENNVMLTYVLTGSNPDALSVLRERGMLESALRNLRARVGGNLVAHFNSTRCSGLNGLKNLNVILNLALLEDIYLTASEKGSFSFILNCEYHPKYFFEGEVKHPLFDKYLHACLHRLGLTRVLDHEDWYNSRYYDSPVLIHYLEDILTKKSTIENPIHGAIKCSHRPFLQALVGTRVFKELIGFRRYWTNGLSAFEYAIYKREWWLAAKIVELTPEALTKEEKIYFITKFYRKVVDEDQLYILNKVIGIKAIITEPECHKKDFYRCPLIKRVLQESLQRGKKTHLSLALSCNNFAFFEVLATDYPEAFRQQVVIPVNGMHVFYFVLVKNDSRVVERLAKMVPSLHPELFQKLCEAQHFTAATDLLILENKPDKAQRHSILENLVREMEECFERKIKSVDVTSAFLRTGEYSGHTQLWMYKAVELMEREQISTECQVKDGRRYEIYLLVDLFLTIFGESELYEWCDSSSSKMNFDELISVHHEYGGSYESSSAIFN